MRSDLGVGGLARRLSLALALTLALGAAAQAGAAAPPDAFYAAVNRHLVERHVLPRFDRLRGAARELRSAGGALCQAPGAGRLEDARRGFHAAMDAWMGVQHLRFGPAELFSRADRFYFWPQARGKVGPAVEKLLAGGGIPAPGRMPTASAAAQGLPALEYLLFERGAALLRADAAAKRRCALLLAVTRNIHAIADGLAADWAGGRVDFRRAMASPGPANLYYKTHKDAAAALFQSLHDGLEAVAASRIRPVLGASPAAARPRLAEQRASGRSTRNIVSGLQALAAMYRDKDGGGFTRLVRARGEVKLDALMHRAFGLTIATARSIGKPLEAAVRDETLRPRVAKLLLQVRALKQIVRTRLATAIGLAVGFNALDGD